VRLEGLGQLKNPMTSPVPKASLNNQRKKGLAYTCLSCWICGGNGGYEESYLPLHNARLHLQGLSIRQARNERESDSNPSSVLLD
jgi:hypothetical protein